MGPFVDATDGVTPETGITLGAADQAEVLKANGAATAAMAGTFAAVTGADGWYDYTASTTDTNTVGEVVFVVQDSSVCLPVFTRAYVLEETIYDALFGASSAAFDANGRVDVAAVAGTSQTANDNGADINTLLTRVVGTIAAGTHNAQSGDAYARLGAPAGASVSADIADVPTVSEFNARTLVAADYFDPATDTVANVTTVATTTNLTNQAGVIASGTAQSVTATTIVLASAETFADDEIIGATVVITGGTTGVGQSRVFTDYTGATDTGTVDTWTTTPTGTITYEIHATAPASSTALPDVNVTQVSGVAEDIATATALATVDTVVDGIQTDLDNGTDGLGALRTLIDALQTEVEKLTTTAHSEPTGVPAANEAPIDKLGYLFMALRNQVDITATKKTFYDDSGTAEWEKDLSDDGTTYSESEGNAI